MGLGIIHEIYLLLHNPHNVKKKKETNDLENATLS